MSNVNLPPYWKSVKLGEIGEIISGGTPSTIIPEYWEGKIIWITPADLTGYKEKIILKGRKSITEVGLKNSSTRLMPKGSVLFSSRAPIGYVAIAGNELCTNQGFKSIIPNKSISNNYLYYYLKASKQIVEKVASGTTFKEISLKVFSQIKIPLPPLPEQHLIVSKIEELFSELDKSVNELKTAKQQLKTYRQSVLKWAFEGKLTNSEFRSESSELAMAAEPQEKYSKQKNLSEGVVLSLPKGWKWVKLGEVCNKIGDIDHKMPKELPSGYPYISTKDFTDDLKISFDKAKYISKEDYINLSRKIKPEKGDIIFPRYGTIGKNILVDFEKEFLVSYSCAVVKPNYDLVLSKFVYQYSLSPKVTEEIRKYTVETTQANIGIASIKGFVFPLPPLPEQKRIVDEIESRLSLTDKMEESINEGLRQAEALRQSILKMAFEGRLV